MDWLFSGLLCHKAQCWCLHVRGLGLWNLRLHRTRGVWPGDVRKEASALTSQVLACQRGSCSSVPWLVMSFLFASLAPVQVVCLTELQGMIGGRYAIEILCVNSDPSKRNFCL